MIVKKQQASERTEDTTFKGFATGQLHVSIIIAIGEAAVTDFATRKALYDQIQKKRNSVRLFAEPNPDPRPLCCTRI